jgi:hypothetical protein
MANFITFIRPKFMSTTVAITLLSSKILGYTAAMHGGIHDVAASHSLYKYPM